MQQQTLFSVIIPTLNEEDELPHLLASLAKQTLRSFEVIVVDAKSKDRTLQVARSFEGQLPHLTVLTSTKKNVGYQRNIGVEHAKGTYVVFFDADVTLPRSFLSALDRTIRKQRSLFLTTWLTPNTRDDQDKLICTVTNMGIVAARQLERPFIPGCNIIIHRELFQHLGGFNTRLSMSEDHDLAQRCQDAGVRMKILQRPKLVMSMRRFRKYGYFSIIRRYAQAWVYRVLKKSITHAMADYPMGGHVYKEKLEDKDYLAKLERKIVETVNGFLRS